MSSVSGFSGVYAVDWAQTAPGEEWGLPPEQMSAGMSWRWQGTARRLDAGVAVLWLDRPKERADPRRRVRARLRRLVQGAEAPPEPAGPDEAPGLDGPADSFTLTDGTRLYGARIIRRGARLIAAFHPLLPPPGRELWVVAVTLAEARPRRGGVICFLPGTLIATPAGPRPVELLEPGERVCTRDNGAQPLVWRGETRLTGAELYLHPHLRPLRIAPGALGAGRPDEELLVSPAHRLLMSAPGLGGREEVLAAAGDLEDGRGIRRDFSLPSVRYVHLLLERHEILTANGVACESFHPGLADPQVLSWHARDLDRAMPGLARAPERYGEPARRCLSAGETGILRPALA